MGQFSTETRQWLLSIMKQRKLLIRLNRSQKPQPEVDIAIQMLDGLLSSYSYENDVFMARFVRQNLQWIETILPGKTSPGYKAAQATFDRINKTSILLLEQSGCGKSKSLVR